MAPATQAIKVVCRVRPHLPHERVSDSVVTVDSASSSVGITGKGRTTHFVFSSVYDEISTQADIYRQEAAAFVAKVWNGQHATLFTYGASGSGKTYTVSGCDENEGLIPRSIKDLFASAAAANKKVEVRISCLEIWKEQCRDLLDDGARGDKAVDLPIREISKGHAIVSGLSEAAIANYEEFNQLYKQASYRRSTGATKLNDVSSRSHFVVIVTVASETAGKCLERRLTMIDLAGSESNKHTGNMPGSERMEESKDINLSLSNLRAVVAALNRGDSRIGYRDSKLTRILQNVLGGTAAGLLICNIAPTEAHQQSSLATLDFGSLSRNVKNLLTVNERLAPPTPRVAPFSQARRPIAGRPPFGLLNGTPARRNLFPSSPFTFKPSNQLETQSSPVAPAAEPTLPSIEDEPSLNRLSLEESRDESGGRRNSGKRKEMIEEHSEMEKLREELELVRRQLEEARLTQKHAPLSPPTPPAPRAPPAPPAPTPFVAAAPPPPSQSTAPKIKAEEQAKRKSIFLFIKFGSSFRGLSTVIRSLLEQGHKHERRGDRASLFLAVYHYTKVLRLRLSARLQERVSIIQEALDRHILVDAVERDRALRGPPLFKKAKVLGERTNVQTSSAPTKPGWGEGGGVKKMSAAVKSVVDEDKAIAVEGKGELSGRERERLEVKVVEIFNSGDLKRLMALKGVGVKRAHDILEAVDENGEVTSYSGACGLSQKVLDKILRDNQHILI